MTDGTNPTNPANPATTPPAAGTPQQPPAAQTPPQQPAGAGTPPQPTQAPPQQSPTGQTPPQQPTQAPPAAAPPQPGAAGAPGSAGGVTTVDADAADKVRVRVNFSGRRYVGQVHLPAGVNRITDVLNNGHRFLHLENVQTMEQKELGGTLGLNKAHITYLQVIEELSPEDDPKRLQGEFLHVEIAMESMDNPIRGGIFIPEGTADAGNIINDERDFLPLSDVEVVGTAEKYEFLAVSKRQVVSILWRYFSW